MILPGLWISLAFMVIDGIWILLLRPLDISFGPTFPPLFVFTFLRASLFCGWLLIILITVPWRTPTTNRQLQVLLIAGNLGLLAFGIYGSYIEPFHLTVSQFSIPVPGLEKPVRIVQLSDIHVEYTTRRDRELPALVASLHPDLIALTGEYVNENYKNDPRTLRDLRALIGQLHPTLGIYAVNGNVESPAQMARWFDDLGVHTLNDRVVRVPQVSNQFTMIGLSYYNERDNGAALINLMPNVTPGDYTLLLFHTPDLAYTARAAGINLYLAGHTHGGQVRVPFYGALETNSKYGKTFEMGLYHLGSTTLFVSRGLGFTGGGVPRIRFLAPPEVVVIDLIPPG
jgi:predicted MPP superfamily phosphohydrolase